MSHGNYDIPTIAIHGGLGPDPTTGAILQPIYQSTTFVQQAVGVHKGFTYSRAAKPTVDALERACDGRCAEGWQAAPACRGRRRCSEPPDRRVVCELI